jgi:hypothetical protein
MKRMSFILLIFVTCSGCEKNYVTIPQSLAGEWSWIRTCGGIYYNCSTPQSTRHNIKIVFTPDSIYSFYQNDTLKLSAKFYTYISNLEDGKIAQVVDFVTFGFEPNAYYYSMARDTLSLWDGNPDGSASYYRRIR